MIALLCLAIVAASLLGGMLPLATVLTHTRLQTYLSLSAGAMLGAAFFHMLPEAVELGSAETLRWAAAGLLAARGDGVRRHRVPGADCSIERLIAMRVTTNQLYSQSLSRILDLQSDTRSLQGQISSGKELTMLSILAAMLGNYMIVVSGGGAFGASATTEGDSPGIDEKELAAARELGQRVAEVAWAVKKGFGR